MKLKAVSAMMLTLLLIGMLALAFNIQSVKAEPTRSEIKVMETRSLNPEPFTQQDVLETIVSQINEPRFTWFDSILVNNIGPRPYDSNSNVQAAEFIAEELNATKSISTTYQWFTYEDKKIANVIGVLPSANPNNQSKIVVGAHFDTVPNSPGADDNGSGTALLLEVAKVLSQFRFNCTIEFVAFNAEEAGLVGSGYYAQQASQAGEDILFVINVDMCIWDNPDAPPNEKLWIVYQGTVPYEDCEYFADLTLDIGYTYTTAPIQKISSTNDTYVPVYNWRISDQASFWDAGIPALWIFEFNGFQNPYMHKPADSMDVESYNFTLGTQAAQVVAATIAKLATPLIIVPDQYEKIQWAIGNASDGDTIFVRADTYYERVTISKSISLIGENRSTSIIDGNGTGTVVSIYSNFVTVRGFTIQNSGFPFAGGPSGIEVGASNCTINNNVITFNKGGISLFWGGKHTITNNTISSNYYGMYIVYSLNNMIFNNYFLNNTNQAYITGAMNTWDNGYPSGGNYWSDYEDRYPDAGEINESGLWDTPYVIDEYNVDNYPIVPEFPTGTSMLLILILLSIAIAITKRRKPKTSIQ
jgi:aminopeptidase YwaD